MKFRSSTLSFLAAGVAFATASAPGGGGYYGGYHPQEQQHHRYDGGYGNNNSYNPQQYAQQPGQGQQAAAQQQQSNESAQSVEKETPAADSSQPPAADSDALPSPWQEHHDPSSGKSYYYNPETSVTQWERPAAPKPAAPAVVEPTATSEGTTAESTEQGNYAANGNVDKVADGGNVDASNSEPVNNQAGEATVTVIGLALTGWCWRVVFFAFNQISHCGVHASLRIVVFLPPNPNVFFGCFLAL